MRIPARHAAGVHSERMTKDGVRGYSTLQPWCISQTYPTASPHHTLLPYCSAAKRSSAPNLFELACAVQRLAAHAEQVGVVTVRAQPSRRLAEDLQHLNARYRPRRHAPYAC